MVEDQLTNVVVGFVYGLVYAGYGISTKKPKDEPISLRKAARTAALFGASGVLVSLRGGELSFTSVDQTTGEVALVGVLFDMAFPKLKRALLGGGGGN